MALSVLYQLFAKNAEQVICNIKRQSPLEGRSDVPVLFDFLRSINNLYRRGYTDCGVLISQPLQLNLDYNVVTLGGSSFGTMFVCTNNFIQTAASSDILQSKINFITLMINTLEYKVNNIIGLNPIRLMLKACEGYLLASRCIDLFTETSLHEAFQQLHLTTVATTIQIQQLACEQDIHSLFSSTTDLDEESPLEDVSRRRGVTAMDTVMRLAVQITNHSTTPIRDFVRSMLEIRESGLQELILDALTGRVANDPVHTPLPGVTPEPTPGVPQNYGPVIETPHRRLTRPEEFEHIIAFHEFETRHGVTRDMTLTRMIQDFAVAGGVPVHVVANQLQAELRAPEVTQHVLDVSRAAYDNTQQLVSDVDNLENIVQRIRPNVVYRDIEREQSLACSVEGVDHYYGPGSAMCMNGHVTCASCVYKLDRRICPLCSYAVHENVMLLRMLKEHYGENAIVEFQ